MVLLSTSRAIETQKDQHNCPKLDFAESLFRRLYYWSEPGLVSDGQRPLERKLASLFTPLPRSTQAAALSASIVWLRPNYNSAAYSSSVFFANRYSRRRPSPPLP